MSRYKRILAMLTIALSTTLIGPVVAECLVAADGNAALKALYASEPVAKMIGEKAKAVLVFPTIVKAGFIVGGQYGEGIY